MGLSFGPIGKRLADPVPVDPRTGKSLIDLVTSARGSARPADGPRRIPPVIGVIVQLPSGIRDSAVAGGGGAIARSSIRLSLHPLQNVGNDAIATLAGEAECLLAREIDLGRESFA